MLAGLERRQPAVEFAGHPGIDRRQPALGVEPPGDLQRPPKQPRRRDRIDFRDLDVRDDQVALPLGVAGVAAGQGLGNRQ